MALWAGRGAEAEVDSQAIAAAILATDGGGQSAFGVAVAISQDLVVVSTATRASTVDTAATCPTATLTSVVSAAGEVTPVVTSTTQDGPESTGAGDAAREAAAPELGDATTADNAAAVTPEPQLAGKITTAEVTTAEVATGEAATEDVPQMENVAGAAATEATSDAPVPFTEAHMAPDKAAADHTNLDSAGKEGAPEASAVPRVDSMDVADEFSPVPETTAAEGKPEVEAAAEATTEPESVAEDSSAEANAKTEDASLPSTAAKGGTDTADVGENAAVTSTPTEITPANEPTGEDAEAISAKGGTAPATSAEAGATPGARGDSTGTAEVADLAGGGNTADDAGRSAGVTPMATSTEAGKPPPAVVASIDTDAGSAPEPADGEPAAMPIGKASTAEASTEVVPAAQMAAPVAAATQYIVATATGTGLASELFPTSARATEDLSDEDTRHEGKEEREANEDVKQREEMNIAAKEGDMKEDEDGNVTDGEERKNEDTEEKEENEDKENEDKETEEERERQEEKDEEEIGEEKIKKRKEETTSEERNMGQDEGASMTAIVEEGRAIQTKDGKDDKNKIKEEIWGEEMEADREKVDGEGTESKNDARYEEKNCRQKTDGAEEKREKVEESKECTEEKDRAKEDAGIQGRSEDEPKTGVDKEGKEGRGSGWREGGSRKAAPASGKAGRLGRENTLSPLKDARAEHAKKTGKKHADDKKKEKGAAVSKKGKNKDEITSEDTMKGKGKAKVERKGEEARKERGRKHDASDKVRRLDDKTGKPRERKRSKCRKM